MTKEELENKIVEVTLEQTDLADEVAWMVEEVDLGLMGDDPLEEKKMELKDKESELSLLLDKLEGGDYD